MAYTQRGLPYEVTGLLKLYPVKRGALFGSFSRNERTDGSDVDLLLDLGIDERHPTTDYVYDLLDMLEARLGLRVDFIAVNGMRTNPSSAFKNVEAESWRFYET